MWRPGEGVDLIRASVPLVLHQLGGAVTAEVFDAGRYERTESREPTETGFHPRLLSTQAGYVELRIRSCGRGYFFPVMVEPRRRIDWAPYAVVMEAHVQRPCPLSR